MKKIITLYFLVFLFPLALHAQEANNYAFSTNNTSSLSTGGGWTTIIGANENHQTFNDGGGNVPAASVVNIPFEVWFMGERFTSFNINTNGVLRFGSIPIFSEGNTYNINGHARLSPFAASSTVGGVLDDGDWETGEVRYRITGTAPNRILAVQCRNMQVSYNSGSSDATFEMRIYETARVNTVVPTSSGQIEFIYGSMRNSGGAITAGNVGIGYEGAPGTNDFLSVNISSHTASTTATNNTYPNGTITQLNSNSNGSRRRYLFNPVQVSGQEVDASASCATSSSFILSWTDNATNEVGIVLYRSTDGVNYTFDQQLPANTTSASITGLNPNTTYHYQIYAVTEGKLSQLATTGTVTLTTLPATSNVWYADASSNWNLNATWINNSVPTATSDVILSCGTPRTVTLDATNECRTLTILENNVLNITTGQTLTVRGDVSNSGTINLNGGTLIIEGNLDNTGTGTINAGRGLLRVAGNFTNAGAYNAGLSTIRFDGNAQQFINHTGISTGQTATTSSNSYDNDAALVTPAGTTTYNNSTDVNIPDNNAAGVSRTITVPNTTATITDITVDLDIDHSYVGDLIVTLTSPAGTTVTLINRVLSGLGNCSRNNINTTLSDAAGASVQLQCNGGNPTINGTYRPSQALSAFDGENPSGVWTLNISDRVNVDTGTFRDWDLNISTTASAGLDIPDNFFSTSLFLDHTINVPATVETISDIDLDIEINHTRVGDLYIRIISPLGTFKDVLASPVNGTGNCSGDNIVVTLDDEAIQPVQAQCGGGTPSINGTFTPNQPLSDFDGENPSGNWTIRVFDLAAGEFGRLMSATLHIDTEQINTFPLSTDLYFHNLEIINTGAGVRTQNTDIQVLNSATWTDGVFAADNNHKFIFVDNATSTVATNASHADMQVRKIGDDAFDFPVGNAGWGAPIGISAPANVTDHFTAQYFKQITPNDPFSKEASIHHVGQCEYWILDRTSGSSNVVVTLSFDDIRSCTVGPTTGLKVVRWDGSVWRDHFNGGIINTPYDGVLSNGAITNFSPFTLGALTNDNILPLTFLSFDAKPFESDAILDWTTTGEKNHDYFEVERSINGEDFKAIGETRNAISRSETKNMYSFIDKNVGIENREAYYRLKQIDKDGTFSYSNIKKVNWSIDNTKNSSAFVAYPNPFTNTLKLDFALDKQEIVEINLLDMTGRSIKTISQSFSKGTHKVEMHDLQNLARGSYMIQLKTSTIQKTFKVVKM
ncbi:proprotein convertase P-domain-containing protein [Bernardetia sp.]|uniref:proprotein convertase P-domain-containing protein n=1 Tax=Bernardetia sp. TaxID=1937974 RepID=UPI0025C62763|nr:proprotein convertase P-domain-containing protein [Bernardetia sp.]